MKPKAEAKPEKDPAMTQPPTKVIRLDELLPVEYNPRTIDESADQALKEGLERFGVVGDIVVNTYPGREGRIVGGFQRWRIAKEKGVKELRCLEVCLPPEAEKELNLRLNANGGSFDAEILAEHFTGAELKNWGLAPGELEAFDSVARRTMERKENGEEGGEKKRQWKTSEYASGGGNPAALEHGIACQDRFEVAAGDVFTIGEEVTVACRSSGNAQDVDSVLEIAGIDRDRFIVVADPPYCSGGFQEAGKKTGTWGNIASDGLSSEGYRALIASVIEAVRPHTAYLFTDWRMWTVLFSTSESCGLGVRSMIVWDKQYPGLGGLWRPQHELIMFSSRAGMKRGAGKASIGNVISQQRTRNVRHYTEKPVPLMWALIDNDRASGDRDGWPVVDPFMGSGTTLEAAASLGRKAVGFDVEPLCVASALSRLVEATGKPAIRVET